MFKYIFCNMHYNHLMARILINWILKYILKTEWHEQWLRIKTKVSLYCTTLAENSSEQVLVVMCNKSTTNVLFNTEQESRGATAENILMTYIKLFFSDRLKLFIIMEQPQTNPNVNSGATVHQCAWWP